MRNLNLKQIDRYRLRHPTVLKLYGSYGGADSGCFTIPSPVDGREMAIIASPAMQFGWEHVSVSLIKRPPNWKEMSFVKDLFFLPEETVIQFHPPKSEYVDGKEYGRAVNCLHLWRYTLGELPRPPKWMVGGMTMEEGRAAMERDLHARRGTDGSAADHQDERGPAKSGNDTLDCLKSATGIK